MAVVKKDGLASRVNRNDANRAILRVGDIEVICGSTFSKILFVRRQANMLVKLWGRTCGRSSNAGEQRCCILLRDRGYLDGFRRRRPKGTLCAVVRFRLGEWLIWNVVQNWIALTRSLWLRVHSTVVVRYPGFCVSGG